MYGKENTHLDRRYRKNRAIFLSWISAVDVSLADKGLYFLV